MINDIDLDRKITDFIDQFDLSEMNDLDILIDRIRDTYEPILTSRELNKYLETKSRDYNSMIDNLIKAIDDFNKKFDITVTEIYHQGDKIYISYVSPDRKTYNIEIKSDGSVELNELSSANIQYDKIIYLRQGKLFNNHIGLDKTIEFSKYIYVLDLIKYLLQ